jgi:aerobic-type carbon monoxide dehydrogenase small subunit (CoxS/CutS family)
MVMAAQALLAENPTPSVVEIREGLAGNLCRCAGYQRIVAAVHKAAGGDPTDDEEPAA